MGRGLKIATIDTIYFFEPSKRKKGRFEKRPLS